MSVDLLIRPAVAADDTVVGELLVHAFDAQFARKLPDVVEPPERYADLRDQARRRSEATVLVGERNRRVIGTVTLYLWSAPRSEAWIPGAVDLRLLAVDVAFQGQGLSHALLDAAESLARGWRATAVCLHTRRGAVGVARLYHARGYIRDPAGDLDYLPRLYLEAHALRLND